MLFFYAGKQIDFVSDFILPVGISFYTFQAIGYVIDVYRGEVEPESSISKYALFIAIFHSCNIQIPPVEKRKSTHRIQRIEFGEKVK